MNAKTHVVIQARMGSTRLPGKVLLPFVGSYTFLEWIVERCRVSAQVQDVIVATTDNPKDDAIETLCTQKQYLYFRGSEDDVLARYHGAIQKFGSKVVVRVTSDNPLTDIAEMDRMVDTLKSDGLDFVDNRSPRLPIGTWSEAFTTEAFERMVVQTKDPYDHEHVTPYFYQNHWLFTQRYVLPLRTHPFTPNVRLTLDTPKDLEFFTQFAQGLGLADPAQQPSTNEILDYLQTHPKLAAINTAAE